MVRVELEMSEIACEADKHREEDHLEIGLSSSASGER